MKQVFNRYIDFTLRSWSSDAKLRISTLIILVFTFSITIFLSQSAFNFKNILNRWGDSTKMTVYLSEGQTQETRADIELYLKNLPDVKKVQFISQEQAIRQFSKGNSLFTNDFISDLKDQEVFPESFEITLTGSIQDGKYLKKLKKISESIYQKIGVEDVSYGQGWIEKYSAFLNLMNSLVTAVVVLFLIASILIISNLVRVMVYNQKEEIEILELVGETKINIRMPFIIEGVFFSVIAFCVGLMINVVLFSWISFELSQSSLLSHLSVLVSEPHPLFIIVGLLLSVCVGFTSSFFTAKSINTGWALSHRTNK